MPTTTVYIPVRHAVRYAVVFAGLASLATGCSYLPSWPLDDNRVATAPRGPENAQAYRCDGGKQFYVRQLDSGKSVWLILPDRQVRLDRVGGETETRYSNGIANLRMEGATATLTDGPTISYVDCKSGSAGKPEK